jgi:hypothetical protein
MARQHDLVLVHGVETALERVQSRREGRLIRLAAEILAEESQAIGVTYSGFCLTSLPHKRLPDDAIWERATRNVTLTVEPMRVHGAGRPGFRGVPFGSRARLILLYLTTEAIRTQSREIELGASMREWLCRMGIAIGGRSYQEVKAQAERIAACRLTFKWRSTDGRSTAWDQDHIVKGGFVFNQVEADQQNLLWHDTVLLGETFYEELRQHPVPISEPAIRRIANQSLTIDLYIWLAYRLHVLSKPIPVSWFSLHEQFGPGYARLRAFRERFLEALETALAVYPRARVDVEDRGLLLHPSPPPVERRSLRAVTAVPQDGA